MRSNEDSTFVLGVSGYVPGCVPGCAPGCAPGCYAPDLLGSGTGWGARQKFSKDLMSANALCVTVA